MHLCEQIFVWVIFKGVGTLGCMTSHIHHIKTWFVKRIADDGERKVHNSLKLFCRSAVVQVQYLFINEILLQYTAKY